MKIMLIGKSGQLGGSILDVNSKHEIYAPKRSRLDVESRESCESEIDAFSPDVVINTSAFHNVPLCEDEPAKAFRINCHAVRDLARICRKSGALFVTFSTDYVFGGNKGTPYSEDDCPSPVQMYGISKLAGEYAALAYAPDHSIVIRTCGLYGPTGATSKGGNFVDKRIADSQHQQCLEMSCDQIVSPTYTRDLAQAVLALIEHPNLEPGIYHLTNQGQCTWYDFTREIYELMNIEIELIPVDRGGKSGEMRRPCYSVLENIRARRLGIVLPSWKDALLRYLQVKYPMLSQ